MKYEVIEITNFPVGSVLRLTKDQIYARAARLAVDDGVCTVINRPVTFFPGETISLPGEAPAGMGKKLELIEVKDDSDNGNDENDSDNSNDENDSDDSNNGDNDNTTGDNIIEKIIAAIDELNPEDYTTKGLPKVNAVEAIVGKDLTREQVDEAFASIQKEEDEDAETSIPSPSGNPSIAG